MTSSCLLLCIGTVAITSGMGQWQIAIGIACAFALAWPVFTRIFKATDRGDFPQFIGDVFPDEVEQIQEQRKDAQ